jgi:uncharacterized RmlC-like cupin family protein
MIKQLEEIEVGSSPAFLRNPYLEWAAGEGVPVIEDFGVYLHDVETKPWDRFGTSGAIVHLKGRGDFISVFLLDLLPGGKSAPQRHLYEQVVYVLSGSGSTTVETAEGATHTFEWGPGSLFAIPLNVPYQHFNGSGIEPARLSVTNNFCIMMNLFRSDDFVFGDGAQHEFSNDIFLNNGFAGEGEYVPNARGRVSRETNFVPNVGTAELVAYDARGKGSATMTFILADAGMHAHCSYIPVGRYKNAHRHGPDYHIVIVDGEGFSLLWHEGDEDFVRIDWTPGWMFAPPDQMYHQHFNTSPDPALYLATAMGNERFPFTDTNRQGKMGIDVSVKDGGMQIDFEDQDPRVHGMYLEALAKSGIPCEMTGVPTKAAE